MPNVNRHGLARHIPNAVKLEVRKRSKFGCVKCRAGLYQYEHIAPEFEDATEHHPDNICLLCAACHDKVSRGHLSKELIRDAYTTIQGQSADEAGRPFGELDLHDGKAELSIGGIMYLPAVRTILRYYGKDFIRVDPGEEPGEPGRISATFWADDEGEVLRLEENEWIGATDNRDIEIVGQRITVRRRQGAIALQLRLEPPGRVVVEQLDMRIRWHHILATEELFLVGKHFSGSLSLWAHVCGQLVEGNPKGAAIEFKDLDRSYRRISFKGGFESPDIDVVFASGCLGLFSGAVELRATYAEMKWLIQQGQSKFYEWMRPGKSDPSG